MSLAVVPVAFLSCMWSAYALGSYRVSHIDLVYAYIQMASHDLSTGQQHNLTYKIVHIIFCLDVLTLCVPMSSRAVMACVPSSSKTLPVRVST